MSASDSLPATDLPDNPPPPRKARRSWATVILRWWWLLLRTLLQFLLIAWATLAIYYSNLPWSSARLATATLFLSFSAWALWLTRRPRMGWAFAGAFLAVVVWFACIRPSNDRPWRPDVAVMPRAIIDGDRVRIDHVRNFDYRGRYDFTPHYETREFSLAHVKSLDLFISYWLTGPVAHTFVSFDFDDGTPPLCISIEIRPEVGEGFAPVASMFKQFELIYVAGDEHDLVGSRVVHRGEQVYLYPIRVTPAGARRMLEIYLQRINQLVDHAEFYHLLSNSCTVNIFRYARAAGGNAGFDVRQLLNGWVDEYLYDVDAVNTDMPFEVLRQRSRITDVVKAAVDAPDLSKRIRAAVPPAYSTAR